MNNFPRRSARLSPHGSQDQSQPRSYSSTSVPSFSQFSQPSSNSTTSHPSPTNNNLNTKSSTSNQQQRQPQLKVQAQFIPQQSHLKAPVPSPSTAELDPFFGRSHSQPDPYTTQTMSSEYIPPQSQQGGFLDQRQEQARQHHPHTNSMSQPHPQDFHMMKQGQLPPDFLAQAAKRAQLECLMRDMGDIAL